MNIFTTRFRCKDEACTFDKVLQTKYEGEKSDREYLAHSHSRQFALSRPHKLHKRKEHKLEITHFVKEDVKK